MPNYDYEIPSTGEVIEVFQSIKDDHLKTLYSPKKKKELPCKRLISYNHAGIVYKGDGWTVKQSGFGKRGYKGKYQDKIRDSGTPVDAPVSKREADMQFQKYIDSGGLQGIKPSFDLSQKARPQTAEQMLDKKPVTRKKGK